MARVQVKEHLPWQAACAAEKRQAKGTFQTIVSLCLHLLLFGSTPTGRQRNQPNCLGNEPPAVTGVIPAGDAGLFVPDVVVFTRSFSQVEDQKKLIRFESRKAEGSYWLLYLFVDNRPQDKVSFRTSVFKQACFCLNDMSSELLVSNYCF